MAATIVHLKRILFIYAKKPHTDHDFMNMQTGNQNLNVFYSIY